MVSTRTSQVAITLCLVFLALFVARVRGQTQSLVIDSATYISGLDLIFNQTSGQFEYQQGVNTGYLRVRGPPGSSINLKVRDPLPTSKTQHFPAAFSLYFLFLTFFPHQRSCRRAATAPFTRALRSPSS